MRDLSGFRIDRDFFVFDPILRNWKLLYNEDKEVAAHRF